MMRSILAASAAVFVSALGACASPSGQAPDLQAQLGAFCNVATTEVAAFESVMLDLSPKAQQALATAGPLVATLCAPGVIASADNLQQFTANVLPALTILAIEYAAVHAK